RLKHIFQYRDFRCHRRRNTYPLRPSLPSSFHALVTSAHRAPASAGISPVDFVSPANTFAASCRDHYRDSQSAYRQLHFSHLRLR
ncbi:hypothetical protein WI664_10360, partial [Vibrio cholerae]